MFVLPGREVFGLQRTRRARLPLILASIFPALLLQHKQQSQVIQANRSNPPSLPAPNAPSFQPLYFISWPKTSAGDLSAPHNATFAYRRQGPASVLSFFFLPVWLTQCTARPKSRVRPDKCRWALEVLQLCRSSASGGDGVLKRAACPFLLARANLSLL